VLVVNPTGNVTVGAGSVAAADGTYLVSMSVSASLNGTSLTMEYVNKAGTFQLLNGTTPVSFLYEGSFPFPATITENLVIGSAVSKAASTGVASTGTTTTTPTTTGVVCPCGLPNCDVNGDGIFDEADIRAIQNALISRNPNPRADVNGDGVVNIQDLLQALQALAQMQMNPGEGIVSGGSACASSGTTTTGTTTTGVTTTGTTTTGTTGTTTP
jgi:hypothetical protein